MDKEWIKKLKKSFTDVVKRTLEFDIFRSHHHQSEIIIDLRRKIDGLRRRHKPFLRAVHGVLPSEAREDPDRGYVLPLHGLGNVPAIYFDTI